MRIAKSVIAALFAASCSANTALSQGNERMLKGLAKAYSAACGPLQLEVWYSPRAPVADFRDETDGDPFKFRIVYALTNTQPPADRRASFTAPAPLGDFFSIFRKEKGKLLDITDVQIDPHHAGKSRQTKLRFETVGDTYYAQTAYLAFTTVARRENLNKGKYVLRLRKYPMIEVDGRSCTVGIPDLPVSLF